MWLVPHATHFPGCLAVPRQTWKIRVYTVKPRYKVVVSHQWMDEFPYVTSSEGGRTFWWTRTDAVATLPRRSTLFLDKHVQFSDVSAVHVVPECDAGAGSRSDVLG